MSDEQYYTKREVDATVVNIDGIEPAPAIRAICSKDEIYAKYMVDQTRRDAEYWRRKYAGQAMMGLLANEGARESTQLCEDAVGYADALIAELEKGK